MVYSLAVSKDASRDIDEIVTYISRVLQNRQAAASFIDNVKICYRNIAESPFMYGLCSDERLRSKGYRKIVVKNYLIFYRVDEGQQTVFVVRVIYGARDYTKLL